MFELIWQMFLQFGWWVLAIFLGIRIAPTIGRFVMMRISR